MIPPGRRRGRPQRLPDDPISLSSRHLTVEHRIAWLLATTRILHPDERLRERNGFSAAAADRGLRIDSSRISRWETGSSPASHEVIGAYESVLGRPPGALSSVADGLRRSFADGPPRPALDGEDLRSPDRLLENALSGKSMAGTDWQELAATLTAYSSFFLRRPEWDALAGRLVAELSRSAGLAYVRRYEAAARLIRHQSAQRHLSRALGGFVMEPDSQVVLPVLQLFTEVDDPAAGALVMRMMGEDNKALRRAASSVAATKLRKGVLPEAGMRQLEAYAASTLRQTEPLDGGLDAFDLAMQLPWDSFQSVLERIPDRRVQRQLGNARSTGELIPRLQAAAIVADLAAAVQADETDVRRHPEDDNMLRRLLREALFHMHKSRRHQAALLLASSPYRHAVARQCHDLVGGSNYFLAARAWVVLMRVGHAGRRPEVLLRAMSEARPTLRSRALITIGLDETELTEREAQALVTSVAPTERGSVRHGLFFALGMSGSDLLVELTDHESDSFRSSAQWWRTVGPAIHEH